MVLVPSYLEVDGLVVPLRAYPADNDGPAAVGQRQEPTGSLLVGLMHVTGDLLARRPAQEILQCLENRQDLPMSQELCAAAIEPGRYDADFAEHARNWERLTGAKPDLRDAYHVGTGFLDDKLVIPRTTLLKLMTRLYELNDEVRSGRMEARVDESMPLPPPRPEPMEDLGPRWDDGEVEELEVLARRLDALDPLTERLGDDTSDAARSVANRRAFLLSMLEVADLRTQRGEDDLPARFRALGLVTLQAYDAALRELRAYLQSPERQRVLSARPEASAHAACTPEAIALAVERPFATGMSVDLFRLSRPARPAELTLHEWLAVCEAAFFHEPMLLRGRADDRAGDLFTRLHGHPMRLRYRPEASEVPRLWRVEPSLP